MGKLRILQVINSLSPAGAEKLAVETSERFFSLGHQVDLLLLKTTESYLNAVVKKNPEIRLYSLGKDTNIYNPVCISKIAKHLRQHQYDIIHVHLFPSFYWVAIAKYASPKSKLIYTEHNTNNRRMGNSLYRFIDSFIYKRYDCHIAISDTVRENLEKHINTKLNNIVTIYNGIDLNKITTAQAYNKSVFGLEQEAKILLQVSAFRQQKNQVALIKAMPKLKDNIHLLLAGTGPYEKDCVELTKGMGLEDRIHFLGVRDDVPRLLKTADIVVLSSHYEGLSLASVEGMASGRPFVASDVPGLTEVVKGAGILFPDNDSDALAASIEQLLEDKALYTKTVQNCLERSKRYDMKVMVKEYLELYKEMLS